MARIRRTLSVPTEIPTTSMADIAFLLLIFFMATTIFKLEEGLPVRLPRAEAGQRIPRENTIHIWVLNATEITINDNLITLPEIGPILATQMARSPSTLVGLNIDRQVPWEVAAAVIEQLKAAHAPHASFTIDREAAR